MAAVAEMTRRSALMEPRRTGHSEQRLFEPSEVSLEDTILEVWEDLASSGRAECPVCAGRLEPGVGCEGCGSELF